MKVLICIPTYDWNIDHKVALALLQEQYSADIDVDYHFIPYQAVHHARNQAVEMFLAWSRDKLLFIDSDNPPNYGAIRILISSSKWHDIMTWLVPNRHSNEPTNETYCVYKTKLEDSKVLWERIPLSLESDIEWIFEVDACGTWFVIIDRKVLEDLSKEYGWVVFEYSTRREELGTWKLVDMDWEIGEESIIMQEFWEDMLFCHRAKLFWYKVFANSKCRAKHLAIPHYIE